LADSALGATVQGTFQCAACDVVLESSRHCDMPATRRSGLRWVDNDVVNALANATGMLVAVIAFAVV
jgi:uncharacterized membrane protein